MTILDSSHIIAVRDCERSARYYVESLGFSPSQLDLGPGCRVVENGSCRICIGECGENDDWVDARDVPYHPWFAYIVVDDPATLIEEYRHRGVMISKELTTEEGGDTNFSVATVDGHHIMFGRGRSG